jgi:2-polyprenyl-6-methoxyphenol hydroxylase-like FAD-dependent oxidoreductase
MGMNVRIVDERPTPSAAGRALIMHVRTLDLLEQRGFDPRMLAAHGSDPAVGYGLAPHDE